jgi:hypothetical protein
MLGWPLEDHAAETNCATVDVSFNNPACAGPHQIAHLEYNSRNDFPSGLMIEGVDIPVDLWGLVSYPVDISEDPAPLILVLHGNEGLTTCSSENGPCIHHEGFQYLIDHLASHGFIAVSVNANRLAGNFDRVFERGYLLLEHLDQWRQWNHGAEGPFDDLFKDKVDLSNIGLIGHSRGGEAVVAAQQLNQTLNNPFSIGAVMSIAPTDKQDLSIENVPYYVLVPACDGDVLDYGGVRIFDRAFGQDEISPRSKQVAYAIGTNHNYFNSFWGRDGGGCFGISLIERSEQEQLAQSLASSFFLNHLQQDASLNYVFTGDIQGPATPDVPLWISYIDPDHLDIDNFSGLVNQNLIGGEVVLSGFIQANLCGPRHDQPCSIALMNEVDALALQWNGSARYETQLPNQHRDISHFSHLALRTTQNPENIIIDAFNLAGNSLDFVIRLTDTSGATAIVSTHTLEGAPFPIGSTVQEPGTEKSLRRAVLRTLRVPLTLFSGVDLANIASIVLEFDAPGSIYLTGLQWTQ